MKKNFLMLDKSKKLNFAIEALIFNGVRSIYVMDEGSKLLGILTAGDIIRIRNRRSDWDPEISEICSVNYIYADASMSKQEIKELLLHHRILSIPIIDETSKLIDTFEIWDIF